MKKIKSNIIIRDNYVEIETPEESKKRILEKQLRSLRKDIESLSNNDLYDDIENIENDISWDDILQDVESRLGKMRIDDIAYEIGISISEAKRYRKIILRKYNSRHREAILQQEEKIEELRRKILSGEFEKRPGTYTFGIEGLVRGIVRDLIKEGKNYREIQDQTNITVSTVYYHNCKIREGDRRKYPPRIMNMKPNKDKKVRKLLAENKRQRDICNILNISSATASVIVNRVNANKIK